MKVGWRFASMELGELSALGHLLIGTTLGVLQMLELYVVSLDIKNMVISWWCEFIFFELLN